MSLPRRRERILDADVKLLIAECEPDSPTSLELLGLLEFLEADKTAEESTRLRFATARRSELHVIEVDLQRLQNQLGEHLQRFGLR